MNQFAMQAFVSPTELFTTSHIASFTFKFYDKKREGPFGPSLCLFVSPADYASTSSASTAAPGPNPRRIGLATKIEE